MKFAVLQLGAMSSVLLVGVSLAGHERGDCYSVGPDVVAKFWDTQSYGSFGDRAAFSFGTDACNIGDEVMDWVGDTADHPVISSSLYHLKDGRFEQVGLSWVKHGWAADQADRCDCSCVPAGDNQHLGVGCADAYSAVSNGLQEVMGPRTEVDAYTGAFPFPPSGWHESGNAIFRRLQVHHDDLEPTDTDGTGYYIAEIQFVTAHDSAYGNQFNNTTWQKVWMSGSSGSWSVALTDSSGGNVGEPALRAWAAANPSVRITESRPPGDGALLVGALVTSELDGWYQYEYAIQNVNAHRGVRAVEIELPIGAHVFDIGFHDVDYHSGEGIDGTDWEATRTDTLLRWQTDSFENNPVANGLRWGTTCNVRFMSNVPPSDGSLVLRPFREDVSDMEMLASHLPNLEIDPCALAASPCPADGTGNGNVDVEDLLLLLQWWGSCGDGTFRPPPDATGDCCVGIDDLLEVLSAWGETCGFEGACCLPGESCAEMTAGACEIQGGAWQGLLTSCTDTDCTITTGACCFDNGLCKDALTGSECISMGGTWVGSDMTCEGVTCGIGADDCGDALFVSEGLHLIDTTMATTDGPSHPEECDCGGDGGATGNDRWIRFMAPSSGQLIVSTCEDIGGSADYDTDLVVYDGVDCGSLQLLGCNDDASEYTCGTEAGGWHSNVVVPVIEGSDYLIRIGGWQEGSVGTSWLLVEME